MSNTFAPYQAATGCTRYGPQGAQALTTYTEDVFAELHRSMGICNCREIVGGSSWSHHAECRAADNGFNRSKAYGYQFALILAKHGARVGIDHIITNARPWESGRGAPIVFSARSPNGRTYTGAHPHKDHNHNGLTRKAGRNLTYATLVDVYGPPEVVARQLQLEVEGDDDIMLQRGDSGHTVGEVQKGLMRWRSEALPEWGADEDFGAETEEWVKKYQAASELPQTGKVDGVTFGMLNRYMPWRHPASAGTEDAEARSIASQALELAQQIRDKLKNLY